VKWEGQVIRYWSDSMVIFGETNRQLRFVDLSPVPHMYSEFSAGSHRNYDARDSQIMMQLVSAGAAGSPGPAKVQLEVVHINPSTWLLEGIQSAVLDGQLVAGVTEDGEGLNEIGQRLASVPYVSSAMGWLRIRESGGTTYYEYAASAGGPFTVL